MLKSSSRIEKKVLPPYFLNLPVYMLIYFGLLTIPRSAFPETPSSEYKSDPDYSVVIDGIPNQYDDVLNTPEIDKVDLEALIWEPEVAGIYPAIIMLHGAGGLYYQSDDSCDDADRSCWGLSGKFRYWAHLLSKGHPYDYSDKFIIIAVDSHTPRGYDHHGVSQIASGSRPANVTAHLGRPWDFYAALNYLKSRDDVIQNEIFALGFSDGGGGVLSAIAASDQAVMVNESDYFHGIDNNSEEGRAVMADDSVSGAVVFYPSCGLQGYFNGAYTHFGQLLVQVGSDDDITVPSRCIERQSESIGLGISPTDFVIDIYEGADHGFDYFESETQNACIATEKAISFFSAKVGDSIFSSHFNSNVCAEN